MKKRGFFGKEMELCEHQGEKVMGGGKYHQSTLQVAYANIYYIKTYMTYIFKIRLRSKFIAIFCLD